MIIFGSFLPSLLVGCATKVYSGLGADIVMESITLTMPSRRGEAEHTWQGPFAPALSLCYRPIDFEIKPSIFP
jgi:hypothetical protein